MRTVKKMRYLIIRVGITLLAILLLAGSTGAVPLEEWNKTFAKSFDNKVTFIQQTSDGGYIFVGSIINRSDPVDHHQYAWVVKIDSNGNEQWSRSFVGEISSYSVRLSDPVSGERTVSGKESTAYANAVQQLSEGGYTILGGYTIGGGAAKVIWLINIDANGNEKWNKTYGGTSINDYAYSFEQTSDSGYILTGSTKGDDLWKNAWLIKTDANGNEQWNKTFGGKNDDETYSVQQTADGGYIIAGSTMSYGASGKGWVIKTDANGNEQWNKTVTYSRGFINQSLDSGYILASPTGWSKIDAGGNEQWNRKFGITGKDTALSYKQVSDGGYIIAGQTSASSNENGFYRYYTDAWLSEIDSNGNEQWNLTFGKPGSSIVSLEQTSDGGYMLAGNQLSSGIDSNTWLIKLSRNPAETTNVSTQVTKVPTQITKSPTTIPTEKAAAGFEFVLAMTTLLAGYMLIQKRN